MARSANIRHPTLHPQYPLTFIWTRTKIDVHLSPLSCLILFNKDLCVRFTQLPRKNIAILFGSRRQNQAHVIITKQIKILAFLPNSEASHVAAS